MERIRGDSGDEGVGTIEEASRFRPSGLPIIGRMIAFWRRFMEHSFLKTI